MTAMTMAGAASGNEVIWHGIDWAKGSPNAQEAAGAYCEGCSGRALEQGEGLAMASGLLV